MRSRFTRRGSASSTSISKEPGPATISPRTGTRPASVTQQAAERVDLLGLLAHGEGRIDLLRHLLQPGAGVGDVAAVGLPGDQRHLLVVVLVLDVADDLLDEILHRDDAVGAAIFVDDQREMDAARLHAGQQLDGRHGGRHEQQAADQLGGAERGAEVDGLEIEGRQQPLGLGADRLVRRPGCLASPPG